MKRVLAFAPIPALFLAGASVARAVLRDGPARVVDATQPLLVVTAWNAPGSVAFAVLAATIALATAALLLALRFAGPLDTRSLSIVCGLSLLACFAWPFVFSSDVYAYAAYGDLASRDVTPYAPAPPDLHDAYVDGTRAQWGAGRFPPCVYGPAFVLFARGIVGAARTIASPVAATLATFRICAMLALLATIACANAALRSIEATRRARILTLGALNPVVLWSVSEGHNDIYALLALACFAASTGVVLRPRTFALLPLAMLVKASAGILALACVVDALLVRRERLREVVPPALAGLAVTLAIGLPPLAPALHGIAAHGRYTPTVSIAGLIGPGGAAILCLALLLVALVALDRGNRAGYAWLGLAAVAIVPNPYPWYGIVLVTLALVAERTRASSALYAVTIFAVVRYLPDAFGNMSPSAAAIASAVQVVPIAFALGGLRADLARPQKEFQPT